MPKFRTLTTPDLINTRGIFVPLPGAPRQALPVDSIKISAGFPSPAADYEESRLDINEYLIRNPVSTFFFPVQGDSMEGAEIFDGDILVVDRACAPGMGTSSWPSWMGCAW